MIEIGDVLSSRPVSVRRILLARQESSHRPKHNFLPFNSMLLPLFGHGLAPTPPNLSVKSDLPPCGAGKDVEKSAPFLCAILRIAVSPHGRAPGEEKLK